MTHSKDCLYHLEQSFLDCTCGDDGGFREVLASAYDRQNKPDLAELCRGGVKTYDICAALDAMGRVSTSQVLPKLTETDVKRAFEILFKFDNYPHAAVILAALSTPIPLTPSDEMVEAACEWAYFDWNDAYSEERKLLLRGRMKCALQAALNLMGGKK